MGRRHAIVTALLAVVACALAACGPRVEYRARPGFATSEDLPNEITLEDGTIIRYVPVGEYIARKQARAQGVEYDPEARARAASSAGSGPQFSPWEVSADGTVTMQAVLPEQVVANTMRAYREERFVELWTQLVATGVRRRAEAADGEEVALQKFAEWSSRRRSEVMTLLNRMSFAFSTNGVIMRKTGPTSMTLELAPQIGGDFRYRVVEIEYESTKDGQRVKLAGIR